MHVGGGAAAVAAVVGAAAVTIVSDGAVKLEINRTMTQKLAALSLKALMAPKIMRFECHIDSNFTVSQIPKCTSQNRLIRLLLNVSVLFSFVFRFSKSLLCNAIFKSNRITSKACPLLGRPLHSSEVSFKCLETVLFIPLDTLNL